MEKRDVCLQEHVYLDCRLKSLMETADEANAQCLEIDVASQGESEDNALMNLREALELHFEPATPTVLP